MLLTALLWFSSNSQADVLASSRLDKPVSISQVAEPAPAALEHLSKAAGIPLKATAALGSEILLLRLRDAPLRDAMGRIANACGGVWAIKDDGYVLSRAPGWEAKKLKELVADRTSVIKKRLADRLKTEGTLAPFDAAAADASIKANQKAAANGGPNNGWMSDEPTDRLTRRLLAMLDPSWLANASLSPRTVFSSNPNSLEQQLPLDLSDVYDTYVTEENLWLDRIRASSGVGLAAAHPYAGGTTPVTKKATRALLVINSGTENGNDLDLTLMFLDNSGAEVATTSENLSMDPDGDMPDPKGLEPKAGELRITIPADDHAIIQNLMAKFGGDSGPKVKATAFSAGLIKQLQRPDLHEPLGSYVSSMILGAAEARDLNVVADLPDLYTLVVAVSCAAGIPTPRALIETIQKLPGPINPVKFEGKWMEVDGASMSGFYAHRSDREAMGRLFTAWTGGTFPLTALAHYAFRTGASTSDMMVVVWGALLSDSGLESRWAEWETLRLLGALLTQFGDSLGNRANSTFTVGQMNGDVRRVLNSVVYSRNFEAEEGPPSGPRSAGQTRSEPEELFPNGLPADGTVSVAIAHENQLLVHAPGENERVITPGEIAMMIHHRDHPNNDPDSRSSFDFSAATFAQADSLVVTITLHMGSVTHSLAPVSQHSTGAASFVSYDKLPTDIRKPVEAALARIK